MKKISAVITMCAMVVNLMFTFPLTQAWADDQSAKQLAVQGNKIVEAGTSNEVRLAGMNIPSLDWGDQGENLYESLSEACDNWNANIIRLPVATKYWTGNGGATDAQAYKQKIKNMVSGVMARGKYIIIDCHEYQVPTETIKNFWMDVAADPFFANNPSVLFGLMNEPEGINPVESGKTAWDILRNGGQYYKDQSTIDNAVGYQKIIEAIRDEGAKNIVIAAGLDWGYDLTGYANGYALTDCGSANDTSKSGNGIMYDAHIYPSKGDSWDACVGPVRRIAPVLIGESGWDPSDGTILGSTTDIYNGWVPRLLNWIDDTSVYGSSASWTAWSYHPGATPRIIYDWNYNPTYFFGKYVKDRLQSYPSTQKAFNNVYINNFNADKFGSTLVTNGKLRIPLNSASAYRLKVPYDWVLLGLQSLDIDMNASSTAGSAQLRIGFEGTDGEIWTKDVPASSLTGRLTINVGDLVKSNSIYTDGQFTAGIKNIYVQVLNTASGTLILDDVRITTTTDPVINPAPIPYVPTDVNALFNMENTDLRITKVDNGPWAGQGDYFHMTIADGAGYLNSKALKIDYKRAVGLWGGFAEATLPNTIKYNDAKYLSFMMKGNGTAQTAQIKLAGGSVNVNLATGDTDWHQYVYKLNEISTNPAQISVLQFYSSTQTEASYSLDDIQISTAKPQPKGVIADKVYMNYFEKDSFTWNLNNMSIKNPFTGVHGSKCMQLSYSNPGCWVQGNLTWDLTGTDRFAFSASASTPQELKIVLVDRSGYEAATNDFIITGGWNHYEANLDDFLINGVTVIPSRIKAVKIYNVTGNGAVSLDNICFANKAVSVETADDPNPVPYARIPSDWQLLASEDFGGVNDGTLLSNYTNNGLFSGSFTNENTSNPNIQGGMLNLPNGGGVNTKISGMLKNPIDLTANADYYIFADCDFNSFYVGSTSMIFGDSSNPTSNRYYRFGSEMNNSPFTVSIWDPYRGGCYPNGGYTYKTGVMQTMMIQISTRTGKFPMMRMRLFSDPTKESPTITPSYWDVQRFFNPSEMGITKFDKLTLSSDCNSGHNYNSHMDNIMIYKSTPVNSFTTYDTGTYARGISAEAIVPPARVPSGKSTVPPQTWLEFDQIPADKLVSQGWYDCTAQTPVLLSNANRYIIPTSMAGKLLKAIIVVNDGNGGQVTYTPFVGYVRSYYDYINMVPKLNTGADYTKLSNWNSATSLNVGVGIVKNGNLSSDFSGSAALITAQYSANGTMKNLFQNQITTKLSNIGANDIYNSQVSIPLVQNGVKIYAPGDTFKTFVWQSNVDNASFKYDIIMPISENKNNQSNQDVITVPAS